MIGDEPHESVSQCFERMDIVSRILLEVAIHHNVTVNEIRSRSRRRNIAHARQEAFVRLRDETYLSYPAIGRVVGDRHHTTVMFGERAARQRIKEGRYL